jgi:hypothetical protein
MADQDLEISQAKQEQQPSAEKVEGKIKKPGFFAKTFKPDKYWQQMADYFEQEENLEKQEAEKKALTETVKSTEVAAKEKTADAKNNLNKSEDMYMRAVKNVGTEQDAAGLKAALTEKTKNIDEMEQDFLAHMEAEADALTKSYTEKPKETFRQVSKAEAATIPKEEITDLGEADESWIEKEPEVKKVKEVTAEKTDAEEAMEAQLEAAEAKVFRPEGFEEGVAFGEDNATPETIVKPVKEKKPMSEQEADAQVAINSLKEKTADMLSWIKGLPENLSPQQKEAAKLKALKQYNDIRDTMDLLYEDNLELSDLIREDSELKKQEEDLQNLSDKIFGEDWHKEDAKALDKKLQQKAESEVAISALKEKTKALLSELKSLPEKLSDKQREAAKLKTLRLYNDIRDTVDRLYEDNLEMSDLIREDSELGKQGEEFQNLSNKIFGEGWAEEKKEDLKQAA